MSESLNSVTLSGNLGRDAEVRYTAAGLAVTTFSLAVSESCKRQDGTYGEETSWVDCTMFGKRGKSLFMGGLLSKGARIAVVGHLHQDRWEKDGKTFRKIGVVVENVALMTSYRAEQQAPQAAAPAEPYADIPF